MRVEKKRWCIAMSSQKKRAFYSLGFLGKRKGGKGGEKKKGGGEKRKETRRTSPFQKKFFAPLSP